MNANLLGFDAFAKTADDRRIRTSAGGVITLLCGVVATLLLWFEWHQYNSIVLRPELVVNRAPEDLTINMDVTFHHIPCDLLYMDIMDLTGDVQLDVLQEGLTKTRLDASGNELAQGEDLHSNSVEVLIGVDAQGQCGSCYGAVSQDQNDEKAPDRKVCCNSCSAVRYAYSQVAWRFEDGHGIEQCEREGYVAKINERLNEGCRVKGTTKINRIGGNIHFAPGMPMTHKDKHVHDLSLFQREKDRFDFTHTIHHFSFGEDSHELAHKFESDSHDHRTSHTLDNTIKSNTEKWTVFSYFLKVVSTRFEYINGEFIETNEFSATQHERPILGGRDDDHPNTLHSRGGLTGVFFYFDISPLKIINREVYKKSFGGFLLSFLSAVAGVLSVGAILDRVAFTARKFLKEKKAI